MRAALRRSHSVSRVRGGTRRDTRSPLKATSSPREGRTAPERLEYVGSERLVEIVGNREIASPDSEAALRCGGGDVREDDFLTARGARCELLKLRFRLGNVYNGHYAKYKTLTNVGQPAL
jgi:hypothetical protein